VTPVSKSPATIHGKSVVVNTPLDHARVATAHEARNEPANAGTATQ
jgi:hypothetical protein